MKVRRRFTTQGSDPFGSVNWTTRSSRITNPDGSVVFEMADAEVPATWSQLATDIMVSKYFRKAGVPQDGGPNGLSDPRPDRKEGREGGADGAGEDGALPDGRALDGTGPERSAKQVIHRLAGCWRHWGETHGYFETAEDAQAFYDELVYMLVHQMAAPNSPQWFNTGLSWAYGISGPAQGHWICDPKSGEPKLAADAYSHPQPHACQPARATVSTPQGPIPIGEIVANNLVGLEVFDGRGDEGDSTTRVVAVKSNGEKPVYRILLKNGAFVEATADHLVLAADERRAAGEWRRVDELRPGMRMRLSTATAVSKQSDERAVQEAALAGWLQGDGFVGQYREGTNRSLTLEFMTLGEDEHEYVLDLVKTVFEGVHFHVRDAGDPESPLDVRRIRLYGESLRSFVEKYDLLREGEELSVPSAVRSSGAQAQAAYLRALFQADGTVRLRRRETRTSDVVLTTVSAELARSVQGLLLNLGIYARVQRGAEKRKNRRTPYFVSIGYAEARKRYRDLVGFISHDKRRKLDSACSEEFPGKALPAVRDERILRIELVGTEPVYDIQTESEQYLCNNIVVHNCFIQSVDDDLVSPGGIMDLWTREARLFKYGSGTGTNFSMLRAEGEALSGGGKSSGLMSWLKIGDRAAAAVKSGGTTRRAAKMVCLDMDHPDIEQFINWKVREEIKVAAMVEGLKLLKAGNAEIRDAAEKMGLTLDYDFNGEAYATVSGQNSNNSVRIPDEFFDAVDANGEWQTTWRTNGQVARSFPARDLWGQIGYAAWRCADPGVQFDGTINAWHTCPSGGRINASNPCVTGDTLVATANGYRRIVDLVGETVEIINGRGQRVWVDRVFQTGVKPVYELKTRGGFRLRLTADHKVQTANRGDVPASELTIDDEVILERPGFGMDFVPEAFGELLGAALGDGCMTRGEKQDHMQIVMGEEEYLVAERLREHVDHCKAWLGGEDRRGLRPTSVVKTQTGLRVATTVRALIEKFDEYGVLDAGSDEKRFTDQVFALDRNSQAAILRGLFTADATVADYGEKSQYVSLDSTSRELLGQVQLLLLGFGIKSKVYENRRALGQESSRLPDGRGGHKDYPVLQMHSLRISRSSRVAFQEQIGFMEGSAKNERLAALNARVAAYADRFTDRIASLEPCGEEAVYDLTEPVSSHFVANGMVVHNCSEYMFLDNTACNLASLNVLKFYDEPTRTFDVEAFEHAVDLWTIVLEISVLMAAFPSREVAELSYRYRTLGLGYANLGAMLMRAGIAYDSEPGRAVCGTLTSILCGRSYRMSALLARQHGPFAGFYADRENMLRVIRNHRRAAHGVSRDSGEYENLRIAPVPIDHGLIEAGGVNIANAEEIAERARDAWDDALGLGEQFGYRNAQVTVIAPTGTIGLLMDCDTTGVEPDFALVKFKKLAGGGYFKIANASVEPALRAMGYNEEQIRGIMRYLLGTLDLNVEMPQGAADAKPGQTLAEWLLARGLNETDLERVTAALPAIFELKYAFNAWSLGDDALHRLGIDPAKAMSDPGFNALAALGLTREQIATLNMTICGTQTVEGAPHLRDEHLPVFDCASRCGAIGRRLIAAEGHIRMMAAAQPFISGAISKTINLPNEATVEEIQACYRLSWELGLKANALYRDGCKLSQPLSTKIETAEEAAEEGKGGSTAAGASADAPAHDGEAAVAAEVAELVAQAANESGARANGSNGKNGPAKPGASPPAPHRRRLPDTRASLTHKFNVAGHEGYLTVGLYEDGQPGELFITMAKEGSTIGGLMDSLGTATSVALQYGVPLESMVRKFTHQRFEPAGMTTNGDIPFAKSLVDYIFRWMGIQFIPGYREAAAPRRDVRLAGEEEATGEGRLERVARGESPRESPSVRYSSDERSVELKARQPALPNGSAEGAEVQYSAKVRSETLSVALESAGEAPPCDVCGTITVRNGTCYKCLNCGNSMGCS